MSFSFRDRPTLRDRLKGKSGDQIMEELKQSFDQDRKKFFESRPNWKQSPASSAFSKGFPFDDDIMPGKSNIQDHLDDIAQRHPEFADQLKGWSDLEKRQEGLERQREEEERREEPGPLRTGNLRNTVPDMQSSSQTHDETDRGQRSQSAPPESKHGPCGQFVSKVDIAGKEDKQNTSSSSSQEQPSQQKVFHIPIYVEGRDEPLLPKEASECPIPPPKQNSKKTSNRIPVHETRKETPHQKQHNNNQQQTVPPAPPPPPPPPPAQQQQQQQQQQQPEQPIVKDPLMQVAAVLKEVEALKERVDAYKGTSKNDKEYMYLDEMLTRNLLKLDNIDTEGKEEVRSARKEVIKRIQEFITQLENAPGSSCTTLVPVEPSESSTLPQGQQNQTPNDTQQPQQEEMEVPQDGSST